MTKTQLLFAKAGGGYNAGFAGFNGLDPILRNI